MFRYTATKILNKLRPKKTYTIGQIHKMSEQSAKANIKPQKTYTIGQIHKMSEQLAKANIKEKRLCDMA